MTEEYFNLIFNGEVESGRDMDEARSTLESLFEFDPENQVDFFNGEAVMLGQNMNATTANSFKQALANAGIVTHLLAAEDTIAVKEIQSQRLGKRRKNPKRRVRVRNGAIIPDRRELPERRS